MKIFLNDIITVIPTDVKTVEDIVIWKKIPPVAATVMVNDRLLRKDKWVLTRLSPGDRVTILTSALKE